MFRFPTKAALTAYIAGTAPQTGLHIVEVDESFYNEKIEYSFKNSTLTRLTNPKIEFIKRDSVNTFADIVNIASPVNKNMVIVLKDETTYDKVTWYTYNVSQWVLMGEYLGSQLQKAISAADTRGAVIHEDTDFTIPFEYVVGRNELSIYVAGGKLSATDFIEVGTSGVRSSKVQFKRAILNGTEIEFVREVHNNQTIDPSYQIVQQKIQDDTILKSRIARLKSIGFNYGGTIQDCKTKDFSKVYYCTINDKFYIPKIKSVIGNMTNNTSLGFVASASSEHVAPFPAWCAFSTDYSKFWHNIDDGSAISASNTEWLKIDLGVKTPITHMLIDPRVGYQMSPSDYVFEGSDDGTTWTTILSVTAKDYTGIRSIHRYKALDSVVANNRYYRLTIKKTEGGTLGTVAIERLILVNNIASSWTVADSDWLEINIDKKLDKQFVKTTKTWDIVYCNETGDDIEVMAIHEANSGIGYVLPVLSQYDTGYAIGNVSAGSTIQATPITFKVRPFDCYTFIKGGTTSTSLQIHER